MVSRLSEYDEPFEHQIAAPRKNMFFIIMKIKRVLKGDTEMCMSRKKIGIKYSTRMIILFPLRRYWRRSRVINISNNGRYVRVSYRDIIITIEISKSDISYMFRTSRIKDEFNDMQQTYTKTDIFTV